MAKQGTQDDQEFRPVGALVVLILYIAVFAGSWAYVYFSELLVRR
jgi:hypothetical protein